MGMSARKKLLISGAAVAIAATTAGVTATAAAEEPEAQGSVLETTPPNGSATFTATGDKFTVGDWKADGYGVRAVYTINGQGNDYLVNNSGAGTQKTFDRNFKEGTQLKLQVCLTKNGTPVGKTCSKWKNYTA